MTTVYPNDPAAFPDPLPSPEINPRNVTDDQTHVFADACLYEVGFTALDDDGGAAADSITVIILGDADRVRSAGYWYQQFRQGRAQKIDDATLECYLDVINFASGVFSEARSVTTIDDAEDVLDGRVAAGSAAFRLDRQLLAAWLNYVNGTIGLDDLIDTDGDGAPDTPFVDVIAAAEASRLDPGATDGELEDQKDVLESINTKR